MTMYIVKHKNPYRYGYWLPTQNFMSLESALKYAEQEKDCSVYDYNFKRWYHF